MDTLVILVPLAVAAICPLTMWFMMRGGHGHGGHHGTMDDKGKQ